MLFYEFNYAGMEVTQEMLQASGNTAIASAIYGEDGGFDFGSGQTMTQKMLASSFADDDGEMWQSVFGADEPANINEMTQAQLIKHMATRTYANADWLAKLNRLSTKGLVMEYLQQQAEINYMLAILKDLKMQSIQQKALLARVTTVGQDKNLDGLAESIHVDYNPNFMDVDLLASGDEWIGSDMPSGGGDGGSSGGEVDLGNLPDDMKGLLLQLNQLLQAHESRGSPYAMNQYGCNNRTSHTAMHPYKPQFDFPNKTLYEVYVQNLKIPCGPNFAYTAGRYQVIGINIQDFFDRAPKALREKYRNRKFDSQAQDEFNIEWNLFFKNGSLKKFFKGDGTANKAKKGLAAEWRSLCDPDYTNHTAKKCLPYNGSKADKADYANTMKIWAIIDKMDSKMRENPNNILNK